MKTRTEYEIQGNYGFGFECVFTEDTYKEALKRLQEYRENEAGTVFKIKKVRVSI